MLHYFLGLNRSYCNDQPGSHWDGVLSKEVFLGLPFDQQCMTCLQMLRRGSRPHKTNQRVRDRHAARRAYLASKRRFAPAAPKPKPRKRVIGRVVHYLVDRDRAWCSDRLEIRTPRGDRQGTLDKAAFLALPIKRQCKTCRWAVMAGSKPHESWLSVPRMRPRRL